jgi:hypothetical protein
MMSPMAMAREMLGRRTTHRSGEKQMNERHNGGSLLDLSTPFHHISHLPV